MSVLDGSWGRRRGGGQEEGASGFYFLGIFSNSLEKERAIREETEFWTVQKIIQGGTQAGRLGDERKPPKRTPVINLKMKDKTLSPRVHQRLLTPEVKSLQRQEPPRGKYERWVPGCARAGSDLPKLTY